MSIECSTCSRPGTERSNPQGEAREGESVSRNASELASAPLCRYLGSGQPPMDGETCYRCEANIHIFQRAPRGGWRQRAETDWLRNLGDPIGLRMSAVTLEWSRWKSDAFIVVRKRGNSRGAKGGDCKSATIKEHPVLDPLIDYTQRKGMYWRWKLNPELVTVLENLAGKPDAGNPHVRFDEGECRDWPYRRPVLSTLRAPSKPNQSNIMKR